MIFFDEFTPKKLKSFSIYKSRKRFINKKNNNLIFLLKKRFIWMDKYIKDKKIIYELGSGNGASKEILNNLGIVDSITALIGRAYSYMNLRNDKNLKIDLLKVEEHLKNNPEYSDYKMFWYLYKIYNQCSKKQSANKFLKLAHISLMNRCKHIINDHHKDYFLNTNTAKKILLKIK